MICLELSRMQKNLLLYKIILLVVILNAQFCVLALTAEPNDLNNNLVNKLAMERIIKSDQVEKVMKSIDRGDFSKYNPYQDRPQPIGYGATISAPHMHAYALEYLKDHLKTAKKCLDIGSGSGYLTLAFAKMMENSDSKSYGIDHIPELVEESILNIEKNHKTYLSEGKIVFKTGDGRKGMPEYAPYDIIHVGAASAEIPKHLIEQLAPGGRMVLPVGTYAQNFLVIDKDLEGKWTKRAVLDVMYVPLTEREKQWPIDLR